MINRKRKNNPFILEQKESIFKIEPWNDDQSLTPIKQIKNTNFPKTNAFRNICASQNNLLRINTESIYYIKNHQQDINDKIKPKYHKTALTSPKEQIKVEVPSIQKSNLLGINYKNIKNSRISKHRKNPECFDTLQNKQIIFQVKSIKKKSPDEKLSPFGANLNKKLQQPFRATLFEVKKQNNFLASQTTLKYNHDQQVKAIYQKQLNKELQEDLTKQMINSISKIALKKDEILNESKQKLVRSTSKKVRSKVEDEFSDRLAVELMLQRKLFLIKNNKLRQWGCDHKQRFLSFKRIKD